MIDILLSPQEARKLIGVGEKTFAALGIPFIAVGKRRKYHQADLLEWINNHREETKCQSAKGKARPSTGTISRSMALDFEEALRQTTQR